MAPTPTDRLIFSHTAGSVVWFSRYNGGQWLNNDVAEGLRRFFSRQAVEQSCPVMKAHCRRCARELDAALDAAAMYHRACRCAA